MALKKPVSEFKIGDEFEAWFWDVKDDKPVKLNFITAFAAQFVNKNDFDNALCRYFSHHELFDTEYKCYQAKIDEIGKQINDLGNKKYDYSNRASKV